MSGAPDLATPWSRAVYARALFAIDPSRSGCVAALGRRPGARRLARAVARGPRARDAAAPRARQYQPTTACSAASISPRRCARGKPVAEPGLLAQIDGGVLVLAMAERIGPGAAARIARAFDWGEVSAERDGFSILRADALRPCRARRGPWRGRAPARGPDGAAGVLDRPFRGQRARDRRARRRARPRSRRRARGSATSRRATRRSPHWSASRAQLGVDSLRAPLLALRRRARGGRAARRFEGRRGRHRRRRRADAGAARDADSRAAERGRSREPRTRRPTIRRPSRPRTKTPMTGRKTRPRRKSPPPNSRTSSSPPRAPRFPPT